MNSGIFLRTARCLACGLPKMGAMRDLITYGAQQASRLFSTTGKGQLMPSQETILSSTTPMLTQTRSRAEIYYKGSAWKRVNKHGIEGRLRRQGGIEVLWKRILKKRHSLSPFDRILPGTIGGKIFPEHHLKYNRHLVDKDVKKRMNQAIRKR